MVDKLMAQAHSLLSQALEKEARRQVRARLDTEARQWAERALDRLSLVEQDIRAVALERTQKKLGRFLQDGGQKVPQAEVSYVVQDEMLRVLGQMVGDVDELLKESATALPSGSATVAHMEPRVSEAPPAPSPEAALSRERGTPVGPSETEEPLIQAAKGEPVFQDEVDLVVSPPTDMRQLLRFQEHLRMSWLLQPVSAFGTPEQGVTVRVRLSQPLALLQILQRTPEVREVCLLRRSATQKGDTPMVQVLLDPEAIASELSPEAVW